MEFDLFEFHQICTHELPFQHLPSPQSQTLTSWLFSREHPHAPIVQLFGKSPEERQQMDVETVPPEFTHACSGPSEILR
jgi:hypothetical protein